MVIISFTILGVCLRLEWSPVEYISFPMEVSVINFYCKFSPYSLYSPYILIILQSLQYDGITDWKVHWQQDKYSITLSLRNVNFPSSDLAKNFNLQGIMEKIKFFRLPENLVTSIIFISVEICRLSSEVIFSVCMTI